MSAAWRGSVGSVRNELPRIASLGIITRDVFEEWRETGREEGWDALEVESGSIPSETPYRMERLAHRFEAEGLYTADQTVGLLNMPWLD